MNRIIVSFLIVLFMASLASAEEAMDNPDMDHEAFYADMVFLGPEFDLVRQHWVDGCQVTIELDESFDASDAMCQRFGNLVRYIFEQNPEICLIYVLPDRDGWVPTAENPVDYSWALCLSDETFCPQSTEASIGFDPTRDDTRPVFEPDPVYPSRPTPVVVTNKDDSGGGGCFIETSY